MIDEEVERKIAHCRRTWIGAIFGFASGAGLMTLVGIIF